MATTGLLIGGMRTDMSDEKPQEVVIDVGSYFIDTSSSCTIGTFQAPRVESGSPDGYRLARKGNGTLILQGAYSWREGWSKSGHTWRDIPTVELGDEDE